MSKRTIGRTPPPADRGHPVYQDDGAASGSAGEDDSELLLLALLEQLSTDRAAGMYRDPTTYCAANPELSDAFLELALAIEWEDYEGYTGTARGDTSASQLLSPGVRRALASLPEFPEFAADSVEGYNTSPKRRRVAENRSSYRPPNEGKRSDV